MGQMMLLGNTFTRSTSTSHLSPPFPAPSIISELLFEIHDFLELSALFDFNLSVVESLLIISMYAYTVSVRFSYKRR